jgi:hypothetical protein
MQQQKHTLCGSCGLELKRSLKSAHTKHRCSQCNMYISSSKLQCKKHPTASFVVEAHPPGEMIFACKNCQKNSNSTILTNEAELQAATKLSRSIIFDRKIMQALTLSDTDQLMQQLSRHISDYNPKEAIAALKELLLPAQELETILQETNCDKYVEKSKLGNIILWGLSFLVNGKHASLPLAAISDASHSTFARNLTATAAIDHNALGVRLENPALVEGLEQVFQLCVARLQSDVFSESSSLLPIYYDWFFFVKKGNVWEECHKVGRDQSSHGLKVGVGRDWQSKAIVSLVMYSDEHPHDTKSFRHDLMIISRGNIVHVADKGPFDSKTLEQILANHQHFIMPMKQNVGYAVSYELAVNSDTAEFHASIPSQPLVRLLEEKVIRLNTNPDMGEFKLIIFQYNSFKTGKFETVELLSSLQLPAQEIINMAAVRWRATETEFRTLQHEFGLEKLYVHKAEKVWPIMLLVLICRMLLEILFRSIHEVHSSDALNDAEFKRSFARFVDAIIDGRDPWIEIEPCVSHLCPYRRQKGQRRR